MKILFINSVCGIRSTGRICLSLAREYQKNGWEAKIAYGRESAPADCVDLAYRIGGEWGVKRNALSCRLFDNDGFAAVRATRAFLRFAEEYNPDVLWLHNLHGYYLNLPLLFAWIKSRPQMKVKWTLHDCWAFTGHCAHFSYVNCDKWQNGCLACPQKKQYPKSLFRDASRKNFQAKKALFSGVADMELVTPSRWLADLVKKSFLSPYPVSVLPNEIDLTAFCRTESNFKATHGLQKKCVVLGVATAWNERKGLFDFYELAKRLGSAYQVVLVGLTDKQIKALPNEVLGLPKTNSKEALAELYSAADVFVNLTYEDTYPTVNLEARACQTPCLSYRSGGCAETTEEGNLVDTGDLDGIVKKIKTLTEREEAKKQ